MEWEKFHYICRRCSESSLLGGGGSIEQKIESIEAEPATKLYGSDTRRDSITKHLLTRLSKHPDNDATQKAFKLYGRLDLSQILAEPLQLRRVLVYLSYVCVIFLIVGSIYQYKVTPTFIATFDTFDTPPPTHLVFYQQYWSYFVLFIFALLGLALKVGYDLKALFHFKESAVASFTFKYFTLPRTRLSYLNIVEAVSYPVKSLAETENAERSLIMKHLINLDSLGMNIEREIEDIVRREGRNLTQSCEQQMRVISTVIAVTVIASIFFFLSSAYAPIFVLGETI